MADFKTHITFSSLLGAGYGGAAYGLFDVPLPTCVLAAGLCGVSGMIPDVDSNTSRPLREGLAFAAAVIPIMLVDRFQQFGLSTEMVILAGALTYLFVRFGVGELVRRCTVHRGMFHSLPAAVVFGELAFLLTSGEDLRLRIYQAGAVALGYLSHLLLDEVYSIEARGVRVRLKQSFGSAVKLLGPKWWPNISTCLILAVFTFLVFKEPGWMAKHYQHRIKPTVEHAATKVVDHVWR